ncbi:serine-rich adhesin for platelets-like [Littorina saxatilis]|uniref:serine-rich adhesin for platelets-like n=1 Tax=Littorina saxatilis TaxID=31220 RepID=UPI0038B48C0C
MAFNFKRPGNLGGPEATRFLPEDEDTMASLDLYIETLEEDKQKEKTWLPPASPFHQSDGTLDIYSGLDDGCTSENSSRLQKTASYKADEDSGKSYEDGACLRSTEDTSATRSSSCQPRAFSALLAPDTEKGKGKASLQVASSPATSQQSQLSAGKTSSRTSESEPDVVLAPTNKDYTDLLDKYRILRGNMLSLLRTAQKELQLKVDTITELRKTVESHGDKSGRREVATADVAHSFVQTEPFPYTLATSKDPQTSACDKRDGKKLQITNTDATVLSETPAQTDAIVISDRYQQTDIVCFKSSSIQTASCILTSSGMQTEPVEVQVGPAVPDPSTVHVRSSAELYRSKAFSKRSVKYSRSVSLDSSVELCKPKVYSLGHSDQAATSGHRRQSGFQRLQSVTYEDKVTELVCDDRNQNMECESSNTDPGALTFSSSSIDKELLSDTRLPEKHSERGLTNSTGIHIDEESLLLMDKDSAESNTSDSIGQQEAVSQKTADTLEKADVPMLPVKENIHKLQSPQEKAHSNKTRRPSSSPEHVASLPHTDNQTAAEGDAWKRNLFLWVDYSHRRVSRRKEIDAFYFGGQSPKVYDWEGERDVSRCLEEEVAEKTDVLVGCQGESQSGVSPPRADEDHVQDEDTPQGQCVKSAENGALSNQSKRKRKKAKKDKRRSGEDGEKSDEKKKGKKKRRESVVDDAMKCMDECQEQRKLGVDESLKSLQEMSACTSEETDNKANHTMTLNQPDLRPLCSEQSTTNSQMCDIPSDSAMAISSQNPLFSSDAELDINPGESRVHEEKECAAKTGELCTVESDISIDSNDTDDTKADNKSLPKRRLLFNHSAMQPVLNSITEGVESMPSDGERSESETEDVIEDLFPLAQSPSHCSVVDSNKGRQNIESSEMPSRQPQASPDLGQMECHGSENLGSNGSHFIATDKAASIIKRKSVLGPFEESTELDSESEIAFSSGVFGPVMCDDDDDFDTSKLDKFNGGTSCLEVTPVKERPTKSSIVTTPKVMAMLDGTPERKSCARTASLSSPSLIWSPDKTCSNIVGLREPLSSHAFHTLAGFSITAGSEDTNMSNASFASGLQHKMPSTDIDPTPLALCTDGEEIPQSVAEESISVASRTRTAVEPTLSMHMDQEENERTVTTLRKVSSRGEERVDVEEYHYQSDMNTPLFGYPSLTSVHKGSCFQYKRTPRFLASSSSSSTLVTSATSASCSATSVVSSSSTSSTVLEVHRAGHVEGPNSTVTSTSMENVQHTGPEVQNKTLSYSSKDGSAGLSSSSSPLKLVPRAAFDSDQCQTTEDLDDSQEGLTQPAGLEVTSILYPENNGSISRANRPASALKDKDGHLNTPQFAEKLKDGLLVQTVSTTNNEPVSVYPVQGVEEKAKDNNILFQNASNTDNLEGSKRGTSNGIAIAEDSLEEGEVRTNDGFSSTADLEKPDLALHSLAEVPECTDNDNAQFTELREMLQHKEHYPSVEKPIFTSGSSDIVELWQKGSQPLAADFAVDIEGVCLKGDARKKKWDKKKESKGVKLSSTAKNTKDLTKEEKEEEDLKRQIRVRQDELRCLIISQQDTGQGLPLKNNPDAVLKTYKIPKVGKKGKEGEKTSATQGHTQKSEYRKPTCRSRAKSKYSQEPSTSTGNILCDVNRRNAEGESHADKTCSLTQFSVLSKKRQQRLDIQSQDVETSSEGPQNAPDNIEGVTHISSACAEDYQDIDIEEDAASPAGSEVLETELDGSGRTRFFNYFRDPFKLRPQVKDFEEDIDDEYDSDQSGAGKTEERNKDGDRNFDQVDREAGHGECQDGASENTKGEMTEKGCQDERQQLPGAEEENEMSSGSDSKGLSSEGECDRSDVNSDHEAHTIDICTTSHTRVRSDETYVVHKNKKQTDQLSLGEISDSDDSDVEQVHVVESEIAQLSRRNLSKHCSSTINQAGNLAETISADCLSLDAFGAGEGHFLSEHTDMSAREQRHIPECQKQMAKSDQSKEMIEHKTRHNSQKSSRATVTSTVTHKSMLGREMATDVLVSKTSEQCMGGKRWNSSTSDKTGCSSHKDRRGKQHERNSLHAEKGAPKKKSSRSRSRSNSGLRGRDLRLKLDHALSAPKRRSPSCSSTKENGRSSSGRQRSERRGNSCDDRKANDRNLSPHNKRGKPRFRSKGRERSRSASPFTSHRCCKKSSLSSRKRSPFHRSNNSRALTTRHRRISTLSSNNSHSRSRSRERFDSRRKRHHSSRSRSQSPARHRERCSSHTAKHKRSRTRSREREGRHTCHTHRDHDRDYSTHTTERSRKECGRSPSPNRPRDCLCDKCSASHSRSGLYCCSGQKTRSHSPLQGHHQCRNRRGDSQDKGHYDRPKERKRRS